jgi:hypothetical protein
MKKLSLPILFAVWLVAILAAFFVVQRPDFLKVLTGLENLILSIVIPLSMALLAAWLGRFPFQNETSTERLLLGTALGMIIIGLSGFLLAISGLQTPGIFLILLLAPTTILLLLGKANLVWNDIKSTAKEITTSTHKIPSWMLLCTGIALFFTFLLCLAPPAEDFDALFYHLAVPSRWIHEGGLTHVAIPHYWYPQIIEGSFVWPIALGYDTGTHLIHLLWFLLTVLLLWDWVRHWGNHIAWDAIMVLLTMPSLLWLASWAYTDYALTFAGLATLFALWKWQNTTSTKWLVVSGIMAGMAISVKYTGFFVPLTGAILAFGWKQGWRKRFKSAALFSAVAILIASPWYIRNWIWMKNPFYPFAFGGMYWDSFLAKSYSSTGSGIGIDLLKILALPLTATLGTHDANFYDGRMGPFFLILSPLVLWVFWKSRREQNEKKQALLGIGVLSFLGILFWMIGVILSAHLFQTRLLFPVLIPLAIPTAIGLDALHRLDTPHLKISFVARFMLMLVVVVNLLNFGLQIVVRNPLAVAIGITSRQAYMEKRQPGYASELSLLRIVPDNTKVYLLFEPRSYGMNIDVQPDAINANFLHDLWLYKTPENIVAEWHRQGYKFILLSRPGADMVLGNETWYPDLFEQTMKLLIQIAESDDGNYVLYKIP